MTKRQASWNRGQLRGLRKMALENSCPECGVEPGALCIGVRGSTRQAPHKPRFRGDEHQAIRAEIRIVGNERPRALEILDDAVNSAEESLRGTYEWGAERCESPIEQILLAQFLHPNTTNEWDMQCHVLLPPSGLIDHVAPPPIPGFFLWPQIKIGPYRVDFIIAVVQHGTLEQHWTIIECDGHDFHERTKAQAQRDKARDRYLVGRGYRVLRFTGSEIYRDSAAVWEEIIKITLGLCDD